jgi:hypothetical protein
VGGRRGNHDTPSADGAGVFMFVRNPEDWVSSWWAYTMGYKRGRWAHHLMEKKCKAPRFRKWIRNIIDHPGILLQTTHNWTRKYDDPVIGRTETLAEDLVRILKQNGEEFDEQLILNFAPVLVASNKPKIPADLIVPFQQSQGDYYEAYQYPLLERTTHKKCRRRYGIVSNRG